MIEGKENIFEHVTESVQLTLKFIDDEFYVLQKLENIFHVFQLEAKRLMNKIIGLTKNYTYKINRKPFTDITKKHFNYHTNNLMSTLEFLAETLREDSRDNMMNSIREIKKTLKQQIDNIAEKECEYFAQIEEKNNKNKLYKIMQLNFPDLKMNRYLRFYVEGCSDYMVEKFPASLLNLSVDVINQLEMKIYGTFKEKMEMACQMSPELYYNPLYDFSGNGLLKSVFSPIEDFKKPERSDSLVSNKLHQEQMEKLEEKIKERSIELLSDYQNTANSIYITDKEDPTTMVMKLSNKTRLQNHVQKGLTAFSHVLDYIESDLNLQNRRNPFHSESFPTISEDLHTTSTQSYRNESYLAEKNYLKLLLIHSCTRTDKEESHFLKCIKNTETENEQLNVLKGELLVGYQSSKNGSILVMNSMNKFGYIPQEHVMIEEQTPLKKLRDHPTYGFDFSDWKISKTVRALLEAYSNSQNTNAIYKMDVGGSSGLSKTNFKKGTQMIESLPQLGENMVDPDKPIGRGEVPERQKIPIIFHKNEQDSRKTRNLTTTDSNSSSKRTLRYSEDALVVAKNSNGKDSISRGVSQKITKMIHKMTLHDMSALKHSKHRKVFGTMSSKRELYGHHKKKIPSRNNKAKTPINQTLRKPPNPKIDHEENKAFGENTYENLSGMLPNKSTVFEESLHEPNHTREHAAKNDGTHEKARKKGILERFTGKKVRWLPIAKKTKKKKNLAYSRSKNSPFIERKSEEREISRRSSVDQMLGAPASPNEETLYENDIEMYEIGSFRENSSVRNAVRTDEDLCIEPDYEEPDNLFSEPHNEVYSNQRLDYEIPTENVKAPPRCSDEIRDVTSKKDDYYEVPTLNQRAPDEILANEPQVMNITAGITMRMIKQPKNLDETSPKIKLKIGDKVEIKWVNKNIERCRFKVLRTNEISTADLNFISSNFIRTQNA